MAVLIIAGSVTLYVILGLIWVSWSATHIARAVEAREVEFERLIGRINHYDAVLTHAARSAAGTGDTQYEADYRNHIRLLDDAIARAMVLAGVEIGRAAMAQLSSANKQLVKMERQAFKMVREGRAKDASELLYSTAYKTRKNQYKIGLETAVRKLRAGLADIVATESRTIYLSLGGSIAAIIVVTILWLIIARILYRQQQQLASLNAELRAANTAKSDFLASMSHEIRTPMNGVLGMASILSNSVLTAEQKKYVTTIQHSGEALLSLLNDILDLSKIEGGHVELENVDFHLDNLMDSVTSFWESQFQSKNLEFAIETAPDVPRVLEGDPTRIRQILFNLIGNARKFTEQGGVHVSVSQSQQAEGKVVLHISVKDTGIGIPNDQIDRLFNKFAQADLSVTRRFGGTGLGLAICKQLVGLMGGNIGVETAEGAGSTFWFTFKCNLGDAKRIEDDLAAVTEGTMFVPPDTKPMRILVAEDNQVNRIVIGAILSKTKHQVEMVRDGLEAVAAAMRSPYDVLLMDIQMPNLDGVSATRKIREIPGLNAETPIIALTANAMLGDRESYIDAGMTDYVSKPVNAEALLATIAKYGRSDPSSREATDRNESDEVINAPCALTAEQTAAVDDLIASIDEIQQPDGLVAGAGKRATIK